MPYTRTQGEFRMVGMSPDGDTVQFYPDSRPRAAACSTQGV